jgi:hypothetical protein
LIEAPVQALPQDGETAAEAAQRRRFDILNTWFP